MRSAAGLMFMQIQMSMNPLYQKFEEVDGSVDELTLDERASLDEIVFVMNMLKDLYGKVREVLMWSTFRHQEIYNTSLQNYGWILQGEGGITAEQVFQNLRASYHIIGIFDSFLNHEQGASWYAMSYGEIKDSSGSELPQFKRMAAEILERFGGDFSHYSEFYRELDRQIAQRPGLMSLLKESRRKLYEGSDVDDMEATIAKGCEEIREKICAMAELIESC